MGQTKLHRHKHTHTHTRAQDPPLVRLSARSPGVLLNVEGSLRSRVALQAGHTASSKPSSLDLISSLGYLAVEPLLCPSARGLCTCVPKAACAQIITASELLYLI